MTIGPAIDDALPELRREAESRMKSRVNVRRRTGHMVQNEASGEEEPEWVTVHTDLPFRLGTGGGGLSAAGGSSGVDIGGVRFEVAVAVGHFVHDTTDIEDDDLIEVVSGEWPGTVWRVVKATTADQKTARRVPIEGAQRPSEWGP